jgi:hypothetical protein
MVSHSRPDYVPTIYKHADQNCEINRGIDYRSIPASAADYLRPLIHEAEKLRQ